MLVAVFTSDVVIVGDEIWLIVPGYVPVYLTWVPDAMFCTGYTVVAAVVVATVVVIVVAVVVAGVPVVAVAPVVVAVVTGECQRARHQQASGSYREDDSSLLEHGVSP